VVADVRLQLALVDVVLAQRPFVTRSTNAGVVRDTVPARRSSRAHVVDTVVHIFRAILSGKPFWTPTFVTVDQIDANVALGTVFALAVVHIALALQTL
jgi:hypothetical protein